MAAPQPSPDPRDGGRPVSATPAGGGPPSPPRRRRSTASDGPPDRPGDFTPDELRFTPQRATRWFSPGVLTQSGLKVGVTSVFGSFLDKRELQSSRPRTVDLLDPAARTTDLWFDYVADTGDGFEATATVAHHVAQPLLEVDGLDDPLPRGELLVLGGDEVYPAASTEGYENRLEGPWRAALPWTPPLDPDDPAHPYLYAVPGNHDWYDGLTGFLRMFGQGRWIGGWRTRQTRSYFAVQLPHRWWLWGIDIQSDALIDEPQLDYFEWVADEYCQAGRPHHPGHARADLDPARAPARGLPQPGLLREGRSWLPASSTSGVTLAGDLHHYARYQQVDASEVGAAQKITAGGGGAFLHPTHDLPAEATVSVNPDDPRRRVDVRAGRLALPECRGGHACCRCSRCPLPVRNPSFMVVPALASLTLLWTVQFGLRSLERPGVRFADAAVGLGVDRRARRGVPQLAVAADGARAVRRAVRLRPDATVGASAPSAGTRRRRLLAARAPGRPAGRDRRRRRGRRRHRRRAVRRRVAVRGDRGGGRRRPRRGGRVAGRRGLPGRGHRAARAAHPRQRGLRRRPPHVPQELPAPARRRRTG